MLSLGHFSSPNSPTIYQRNACKKCGKGKDGSDAVAPGSAAGSSFGSFGGNKREGDWDCQCGFNNFASVRTKYPFHAVSSD